jgi:hypothetical protein
MAFIHTVAASKAGRLATVPEESADGSAAGYPLCGLYRDSIGRVAVSRAQIRSTLFSRSQSGRSYSSDSGASNSCPSSHSGISSVASLSGSAAELGNHELKMIARRMVCDGYTQCMVQAFNAASPLGINGGPYRALEIWFFELDVDCVLQIREKYGSQWQLRLQDRSALSLQDLVERWIRGLTVIVHSMIELLSTNCEMKAAERFGEASISKMLIFVDAIVPALKVQNLRAVLDMYICVCRALHNIEKSNMCLESDEEGIVFSLFRLVNKLSEAIPKTMEKVRTLIEDDDSWAIEIPRRGGEVHMNTRLIADYIVSLGEAEAGSTFLSINSSGRLPHGRDDTIRYLKDLLLRKSEICSDPSLRYLFLLNNSHFVAQLTKPCESGNDWKLTTECQQYMDSYVYVSWAPVLSCIPKSHYPGPLGRWFNTTSLAKFQSVFHKVYKAQRFWKVPDPRLRSLLRKTIINKVILGYRYYLKEHPELEKHVNGGNSSPDYLEEMFGELFER